MSALVVYGSSKLDFAIRSDVGAAVLATALAAQAILTKLHGLPRFDPRSALISGLSLCLLLRTNEPWLGALGAAVAVSSKFWLRAGERHVFNPTNLALAVLLATRADVWVSPGQWGTGAFLFFLLAGAGMLVTHRAERSDVTYAFGAAYASIVLLRAAWLGDPWSLPLHHLESGALLLFAFFMISDPKTTPDSRAGRILFAVLVALGAATVHFVWFQPNGFLWALVALSPATPLINRVLPGARFQWPSVPAPTLAPLPSPKGATP